jgi:hypothetical protein
MFSGDCVGEQCKRAAKSWEDRICLPEHWQFASGLIGHTYMTKAYEKAICSL